MSYHNTKQRLEKASVLANEALKLAELCRNGNDDELKAYQLSQVESLARDVCADCGEFSDNGC